MAEADALLERLGLRPHPEGGHNREMWRDAPAFDFAGFEMAPPGWEPA